VNHRVIPGFAAALLTWTGLGSALVVSLYPGGGLYVFLALSERYGGWVLPAYALGIGATLVAAATLLALGGHDALKGRTRRGGLQSLTAGLLLLGLYAFIHIYTGLTPSFGLLNTLLFLPALLGGLLALATPPPSARREKRPTLTASV